MSVLHGHLALCASVVLVQVSAQDPFHRSFTVEDGLPSDHVYCALQDREGFMWFGTDAGVSRFDGLEFVNYSTADGLADNEVIVLYEDPSGRLWFLSINGKLSYWQEGVIHNSTTDPDLARYRGRSGWHTACTDRQGRTWFAGIGGELLRLDPDGDTDSMIYSGHSQRNAWAGRDGTVWSLRGDSLQHHGGEGRSNAYRISATPFSQRVAQPRLSAQFPVALADNRLVELGPDSVVTVLYDFPPNAPHAYRTAWREAGGDVWLYRFDLGVDRLAWHQGRYDTIQRMFSLERINSVEQDRNGDHWLCTAGSGVLLISAEADKSTQVYNPYEEQRQTIHCLHDGGARLWLGSDRGSLYTYGPEGLRMFLAMDPEHFKGRVVRMAGQESTGLWFACDFGFFTLPPGRQRLLNVPWRMEYDRPQTVEFGPAKNVCLGAQGRVWASMKDVTRVVMENGELVRRSIRPTLSANARVHCLEEDAAGVLWHEKEGGLVAIQGDSIWEYDLDGAASQSRITDLCSWNVDTLAIATMGHGVLLWSRGRTVGRIGSEEGLCSPQVRRVRVHGDTLWAATHSGATAAIVHGGQVWKSWSWTARDGLPSTNVTDVLVRNGRLFLATSHGLCVSGVEPHRRTPHTPALYLARVASGQEELPPDDPIRLLSERGRLVLDVHAITFVLADLVDYAFRINDDGAWTACAKGHIVLDQPAETDRSVQIRARFPGGEWCSPLIVPLRIRPPWWATRMAKFATGLGLMSAMLLAVYGLSRRRYRRKLAAARTHMMIEEERRRIAADVHDDLGADLSRVLMHARQLESTSSGGGGPKVSEGIVATIDKIDEIIWSLDPKRDTVQSTVHFIEQQARELAEAHGLKFRTHVDMPEHEVALDAHQRRELMLIAREAMRNVVKHAYATTLRVDWHIGPDNIALAVEDDGRGISQTRNGNGRHGLANMRERAERLGGTWEIRSVEPSGTRVEVSIALPANHPIG